MDKVFVFCESGVEDGKGARRGRRGVREKVGVADSLKRRLSSPRAFQAPSPRFSGDLIAARFRRGRRRFLDFYDKSFFFMTKRLTELKIGIIN